MNIFDKYTPAELRQLYLESEWPESFKKWLHEQMAYELLDRWLENVDEDIYNEMARDIIETTTYGYDDSDGKEMLEFHP